MHKSLSNAAPKTPVLSNKSGTTPIRVQRSRVRKQVSPNALPIAYVGRPTRFGNPFKVGMNIDGKILDAFAIVELYRRHFYDDAVLMELARTTLSDKNLSCWCRTDNFCHADVLLEF